MNRIPIEVVMHVVGFTQAHADRLAEISARELRALVEGDKAELVYFVRPRDGIVGIHFPPITNRCFIAWVMDVLQGMGCSIMAIRREVMEGALA